MSKRMRWAGHLARIGEKRSTCRLLVLKPGGRRPLLRPKHRWVDNFKIDLGEVGWGDVDWIGLAKDRNEWKAPVKAVMTFGFHKMLGNCRLAT
jgi:hypothetical protein